MGPVLEAIDAGHFARTPEKGQPHRCGGCGQVWTEKKPCDTVAEARRQQLVYAESLRRNALTARETRRTYV